MMKFYDFGDIFLILNQSIISSYFVVFEDPEVLSCLATCETTRIYHVYY